MEKKRKVFMFIIIGFALFGLILANPSKAKFEREIIQLNEKEQGHFSYELTEVNNFLFFSIGKVECTASYNGYKTEKTLLGIADGIH